MSAEILKNIVRENPGCKGVWLVTEYVEAVCKSKVKEQIDTKLSAEAILTLLNDLVKSDDIVEVEYVLPDMQYRIKSLYFPKGTEVTLKGAK